MNRFAFTITRITIVGVLCLSHPVAALADEPKEDGLHIEAQPLSTALREFSEQTGLQVGYASELAEGKSTEGVEGIDDPALALESLLASSGLKHTFVNDQTVVVQAVAAEIPEDDGGDSDSGNGRTAGATPRSGMMAQAAAEQDHASQSLETDSGEDEKKRPLEEVIVVGTQIRGIRNTTSPIQVFDRDDIDKSGFATTQRFVQSLPVNFNGGFSDSTIGRITGGGEVSNRSQGTGINLRGLGNDSTLVLVNGQRIVSGNEGDAVDLSLIPASAIERIEILTDGASALYGADAVGGVVNIRLRDDFDGFETRIRHGRATQGGLEEYRVGLTGGTAWNSGSTLASFEWYSRGDLRAVDRSFSEASAEQLDLVPSQRRRSVFANAKQALDERTEISGFATYAARDSLADFGFVFGDPSNTTVEKQFFDVEQYSVSLAVEHELTSSWSAKLSGGYGVTKSKMRQFRGTIPVLEAQLQNDAPFNEQFRKPELGVAELKADGDVFSAPGGSAKLAIGAQYRRDELSSRAARSGISTTLDRNVAAVFGEAYLPLVSDQNRIPGINALEVTAAGRFEHFSDFGSKTNPKVGARWSPVEGVNIRGTWGKSFRAPLLTELDDSDRFTAGLFQPDPTSPTGISGLAVILNSNPNLGPENATIWSIGFDISDFVIPGLDIEATYFDVAFTNRIDSPSSAVSLSDAFLREDDLGPLLTRMLDPSVQAELFSNFDFNLLPTADDIDALFDARKQNLSDTNQSGVDFAVQYVTSPALGDLTFTFSGTYIRKLETRVFVTTPFISQVDTLFNPVDLRFRTGVSWSRSGTTLSGFVNYVDDYTNVNFSPAAPVKSFTTVDLTAGFDIGKLAPSSSLLRDLTLQVSATNLLNEDPPFVQIPTTFVSVFFDGANANPFGRVVAVELVKGW